MKHVVLSDRAKSDLLQIYKSGVTAWGRNRANDYYDQITARLNEVAEFPDIGPNRPEISDDAQTLLVNKHILLYEASADQIHVLRVLHVRMDLEQNSGSSD